MNSVIVKNMFDGKEYTFPIISEYMSIKDLKQSIQKHLRTDFQDFYNYKHVNWKSLQLFVNNRMTTNDDLLIDLVVNSNQNDNCLFYLIIPSEENKSLRKNKNNNNNNNIYVENENGHGKDCLDVEPFFDRSSLLAASLWFNENLNKKFTAKIIQQQHSSSSSSSSFSSTATDDYDEDEINYQDYDEASTALLSEILSDFIEYDNLGLPCYGEIKKSAIATAAVPPQAGRDDLQWMNMPALFAVVTRIIIICMWFGRGGISSFPIWKIVAIIAAIIVSYLFEIGLVTRGLRQVASAQLAVWLNTLGLGALVAGVGIGVGAVSPEETVYETMIRLAHTAAAIPTEKYIVYDIYAVFISLILSLFPSWQPRAAIPAPVPVPAAQPQREAAAIQPIQLNAQ